MDCRKFKTKPVKDGLDLAAKEQIYVLLTAAVKSITFCCISKVRIKQMLIVNSKNKQDITKPDKFHTFLQVVLLQ